MRHKISLGDSTLSSSILKILNRVHRRPLTAIVSTIGENATMGIVMMIIVSTSRVSNEIVGSGSSCSSRCELMSRRRRSR